MEGPIDRKYIFTGYNPINGKVVTQDNAVVFCAKDIVLLRTLPDYIDKAIAAGADNNTIESIKLLMGRIAEFQEKVECKIPDIKGREVDRCIEGDMNAGVR